MQVYGVTCNLYSTDCISLRTVLSFIFLMLPARLLWTFFFTTMGFHLRSPTVGAIVQCCSNNVIFLHFQLCTRAHVHFIECKRAFHAMWESCIISQSNIFKKVTKLSEILYIQLSTLCPQNRQTIFILYISYCCYRQSTNHCFT